MNTEILIHLTIGFAVLGLALLASPATTGSSAEPALPTNAETAGEKESE